MTKLMLSWNDRFALIDHFAPSDAQVCAAFGLSQDELDTARSLRTAGTFAPTRNFEVTQYASVFTASGAAPTANDAPIARIANIAAPSTTGPATVAKAEHDKTGTQTTHRMPTATVHAKPESASKRVKEPQKRGRKGDKIVKAFSAVPTTQTPIDQFIAEHGVSLAVLRQSKRFLAAMDPAIAASIGKINVRQDKATHQLMIWREASEE